MRHDPHAINGTHPADYQFTKSYPTSPAYYNMHVAGDIVCSTTGLSLMVLGRGAHTSAPKALDIDLCSLAS